MTIILLVSELYSNENGTNTGFVKRTIHYNIIYRSALRLLKSKIVSRTILENFSFV